MTPVVWPLPAESITARFDEPRPYGKHGAIDFGVRIGTPIKAVMDGVILDEGFKGDVRPPGVYDGIPQIGPTMGGLCLFYRSGDFEIRDCHLDRTVLNIGDSFKAGDVIAYSGNTGYSTGPHDHHEWRYQGKIVDPEPFLRAGQLPSSDSVTLLGRFGDPLVNVTRANAKGEVWGYRSRQGKPSSVRLPLAVGNRHHVVAPALVKIAGKEHKCWLLGDGAASGQYIRQSDTTAPRVWTGKVRG